MRDMSFLPADTSISAVGIEGILELGQMREPLVMPSTLALLWLISAPPRLGPPLDWLEIVDMVQVGLCLEPPFCVRAGFLLSL